jgi:hypothetical protein
MVLPFILFEADKKWQKQKKENMPGSSARIAVNEIIEQKLMLPRAPRNSN